ncbi:hypothetical protein RchiOBHm_Chr4g0440411 [Rosa chinensis]|uniref:Uncharacterized protein n=1 Tax=Rosa chinensis TaxID=74649 RepID=A0A2P6R313_ROSCH|nr:hypothetical protein RchiOBHm_Chr4g0440411 [Rosa chinensis]
MSSDCYGFAVGFDYEFMSSDCYGFRVFRPPMSLGFQIGIRWSLRWKNVLDVQLVGPR